MNQKVLKQILQTQKTSRVEAGFIFRDDQILKMVKGMEHNVTITSKMIKKYGHGVSIAHTHPFKRHDNHLPSYADLIHSSDMVDAGVQVQGNYVVSEYGYFNLNNMTFYCWDQKWFKFYSKKEKLMIEYEQEGSYPFKLVKVEV